MKLRLKTIDKKPWEEINLAEIQPYPSKYNKVIIVTYLFAFSVLFIKFMDVNSILEAFIPFIKLAVYVGFAYTILKMVLKKTNESVISVISFLLPIYTLIIVIISILIFLVLGISFSNILSLFFPSNILNAISIYLYAFFGLIGWLMIPYFFTSNYPKIQINGFILILMLLFYFFSGSILQIY